MSEDAMNEALRGMNDDPLNGDFRSLTEEQRSAVEQAIELRGKRKEASISPRTRAMRDAYAYRTDKGISWGFETLPWGKSIARGIVPLISGEAERSKRK